MLKERKVLTIHGVQLAYFTANKTEVQGKEMNCLNFQSL